MAKQPHLGLFSTGRQLDVLIEYFDKQGGDVVFVALTAEADCAAQLIDVGHITIDDCYNYETYLKQCEDNRERATALCAALNMILGVDRNAAIPDLSAIYFFHYFKILIDQLLFAGEALSALASLFSPKGVVYFPGPDCSLDSMLVQPNNFILKAVPIVFESIGSECLALAEETVYGMQGREQVSAGPWRRFRRKCKSIAKTVANIVERPRMRLVAVAHWPDTITRGLKEAGIAVTPPPYFSTFSHKGAGNETRRRVRNAAGAFFRVSQYDLYPLVEERLIYFLTTLRSENCVNLERAKLFLQRMKADAVLTMAVVHPHQVCLAVAAKQLGIPVIVMQHGGGNGYYEASVIWHYDFYFADVYFSYGQGVDDYFKASREKTIPSPLSGAKALKMYSVGRHDLEMLRRAPKIHNSEKTTRRGRRRVLFVLSSLYGFTRFGERVGGADIWYWRLQKDVAELCLAHDDVDLVIKAPPIEVAKNPLEQWLKQTNYTNWTSRQFEPLPKLLDDNDFDLIICHAVATALLQCAATSAPIIALFDSRYIELDPIAEFKMRKRMFVARQEDDFLQRVEAFLASPCSLENGEEYPLSTDFLDAYGHPGEDENVTNLMSSALLETKAAYSLLRSG